MQHGGEDLSHGDISKVRLAHLSPGRRTIKEGKCGAAFSKCSRKIRRRISAEVSRGRENPPCFTRAVQHMQLRNGQQHKV